MISLALIPINMEFFLYKSQTSLVWVKQPLACSYILSQVWADWFIFDMSHNQNGQETFIGSIQ